MYLRLYGLKQIYDKESAQRERLVLSDHVHGTDTGQQTHIIQEIKIGERTLVGGETLIVGVVHDEGMYDVGGAVDGFGF